MTTQNRLNELNAIQADWMAISSDSPEKEKQRVFVLMEKIPKVFLSISEEMATVIWNGQPMNRPMSIESALEYHGDIIPEKDIAWKNGQWVAL